MKTDAKIPTEIGSHPVIRHAYENVLNACARLASFATGEQLTTDGRISRQQELLAVDDLVSFAIHGRRLIENTTSGKRFKHVSLSLVLCKPEKTIEMTRIGNILIHHKKIDVVRSLYYLELLFSKSDPLDTLVKYYGTGEGRDKDKQFAPVVFVRSERNPIICFNLCQMVEVFQCEILNPIIKICAAQTLYLDDDDLC